MGLDFMGGLTFWAAYLPGLRSEQILHLPVQARQSFSQKIICKAKIVEPKVLGGLTVEQPAEVMKISPQTVMRD
jgi:hypothetical protein